LIIAAPMSGSGKTTLTLGLLAALARRGLAVQPFKIGPDFIDPGHHSRAAGRTSRNLDGWMLAPGENRRILASHAADADIAVVEGVMGLFDGRRPDSDAGSTAEMARLLHLPVLLVVDAGGMARSAAALVHGFETFDPRLRLIGIVFNRLGSRRHLELLRQALTDTVATPCLGGLLRDAQIAIPERHLGLVTGEEHPLGSAALERLAGLVETGIDLERLLALLPPLAPTAAAEPAAAPEAHLPGVRIGVARDEAFCFYYADNLERLADAGAELIQFSPLRDHALPARLDGLLFGGGYPELFAAQLAANDSLRRQVSAAAAAGMPVYGECGGFMFLCRALIDAEGRQFPMAGVFPMTTRMLTRLKSLGYREVRLSRHTPLGAPGTCLRGHEFHYSELAEATPSESVPTAYHLRGRDDQAPRDEGYLRRQCLGSYVHLHFGSHPDAARHFVDACRRFRRARTAAAPGDHYFP
jgi:cobyrinic acid a,c-diamide synthase